MKKLILILALFVASSTSGFSQIQLATNGVTHTLATSNAAAALADSIHTIGFVDMRDGTAAIDSFSITFETTDSSNVRFYVIPLQDLSAETVADSVAGIGPAANVATGGYQMTADGIVQIPWHAIATAITSRKLGAKAYRIYMRLYAVGTELRGTSKQCKVKVNRYK